MNKSPRKNPDFYELQYGPENLPFMLTYADRKRLSISVHPDLKITVVAPIGKTLDQVLSRLKRRAPWIIKQRYYFKQFHPLLPERKYVSGETHYYLGRQYRLKIIKQEKEDVKLRGRYFRVYTPQRNNRSRVEKLMNKWYRAHAQIIFDKRFELCYDIARKFKIPRTSLRFRKMIKRWGSCANSDTITLNTELIKTPLYCIDYVIMHELCHLKIRNHCREYYRLLSLCMPDWKLRKERLEKPTM